MAFQEVGSMSNFVKYEECKPEAVIAEGFFMGSIPGKFGENYLVDNEDGTQKVLPSSGHLNYLVSTLSKGDYIQVTYMGKEVMKKGKFAGKSAHTFKVGRDVSRSKSVAPASTPVGGNNAESDETVPF